VSRGAGPRCIYLGALAWFRAQGERAQDLGFVSCSALTLAAGFRALSIARCDKRLLKLHLLLGSHSGAAPQGHIFYGGIREGWSLGGCLRSCVHQ
jgi:hypothetical protein